MIQAAVAARRGGGVELNTIDAIITGLGGGAIVAVVNAIASIRAKRTVDVTAIESKRQDTQQALIDRLSKEIDSLHARSDQQQTEMDKTRDQNFQLERKMLEQEINFTRQITELKNDSRIQRQAYEEQIEALNGEIERLTLENTDLKAKLAESSIIGGTERRHGEAKVNPVISDQKGDTP